MNTPPHADKARDAQAEYWEAVSDRRSADHPVVVAFAAGILRDLGPYLTAGAVLEVGCGNGFLSLPLSRKVALVGVDFSRHMLAANPIAGRVVGRAEALPFADGAFPLVFCQALLHHCPDPAAALAEMARVSSCYVIAHEPNRNHPAMAAFSLSRRVEWGALRLGPRRLRRLFEDAGLVVEASRVRGLILPNRLPRALLSLFAALDRRTSLARRCGFYRLVVGRKPAAGENPRLY